MWREMRGGGACHLLRYAIVTSCMGEVQRVRSCRVRWCLYLFGGVGGRFYHSFSCFIATVFIICIVNFFICIFFSFIESVFIVCIIFLFIFLLFYRVRFYRLYNNYFFIYFSSALSCPFLSFVWLFFYFFLLVHPVDFHHLYFFHLFLPSRVRFCAYLHAGESVYPLVLIQDTLEKDTMLLRWLRRFLLDIMIYFFSVYSHFL